MCLPGSVHASLLTIAATDLCAIAVYTLDGTIEYQQPTWGEHGGPLLIEPGPRGGQVTLLRWTPPDGPEGAMTLAKTTLDANLPADAFAGVEALDLGFRPGTAFSYSLPFPDTKGELVVADGAATSERYPVNGLFSMAALATPGGGGRVVYTGLSPLGDDNLGPSALYAADDCAGDFVPMGEPACKGPIEVAAWGDSSGPVARDAQGNVFALMFNFSGDQVARAFASSTIAFGAAPTEGDALFEIAGFGLGLAAIAPTESAEGIVAFQPADAMTFEALDVLQIRYTATNDTVTAPEPPEVLFSLPLQPPATAKPSVGMLTDPLDHLWVGVPTATGTTFVVIARKPQ